MTLARLTVSDSTRTTQALMVLGGTLFIALAAQISVPMFPVPMTLQTLAVLLVGLTLGARLGALTVLAYLGEGALGLPVFANAMNGAAFFGPTTGFLLGFIALAWAVGLAADRGLTRSFAATALVCALASVLLYVPGAAWPMLVAQVFGLEAGWVDMSLDNVWQYFVAPFILGDVIKSLIAAVLVTGATAALRNRKA